MPYTKSQVRILRAANDTFIALKAANPDLWYDMNGGHLMTLRYSNGSVLNNVRPDCSGVMGAIITYMGYDIVGGTTTNTRLWYGHTTNDIIKDKNGGYSRDWIVRNFDPTDRQPGDILVSYSHTDMYVFMDAYNCPRGFNAGSGNHGSSIGTGMQYSVNLADYYVANHSWTGGGNTVGAYTLDEASGLTMIRYVGDGTDPATSGSTFTTNLNIYDVSGYQINILNDFDPTTTGGLLIQVGRVRSYGLGNTANDKIMSDAFKQFVQTYKGIIPLGFYFYSYLPFETSEGNTKDALQKCFQFMESEGVNPDVAQLGVWLDLESDGPTPSTPDVNIHQVQWFRDIATSKGYQTAGLYSNAAYIGSLTTPEGGNFYDADLANVPIWAAWLGQTISGINTWAGIHGYQKVHLLQDSWTYQVGGENVDHDLIVQPIPYGSDDYSKPEDGTSNTGSGTYRIVPAKKIIFNPPPGQIDSGTIVTVETDAANTEVFVTTDNTVPSYGNKSQNWTGKKYVFRRNYHLRAYAFDSTGTVKAKGAATYTIRWIRPKNEPADNTIKDILAHAQSSTQRYLQYRDTDDVPRIQEYQSPGVASEE